LGVGEDPLGLPCRSHAHRHEVFLIGVGRNRSDAGRHRDGPRLGDQRCRRDLHHHVAAAQAGIVGQKRGETLRQVRVDQPLDPALGDRLKGCERHGQHVQRLRHRLPMEVPARDHVPVLEDQRVVRGCIELDGNRLLSEADGIGHGAEDLRRAAEAVCILDSGIVLAV